MWGQGRRAPLIAATIAAFLLFMPMARADEYVQLGTSSSDPTSGTRVQTSLTQPALGPNYPSGNPDRFYWIGTTFSSGAFYQTGYRDPALNSECGGLQWFMAAFNAAGQLVKYVVGGCGTSGARTFTIQYDGVNPASGNSRWIALMDGSILPNSAMDTWSTYIPSNRTSIVSEVATTGSFGGLPGLPSVTYNPAIVIYRTGSWHAQTNGKVYRANGSPFTTPCPPYYISDLGTNSVRIYSASSGTCLANGVTLW